MDIIVTQETDWAKEIRVRADGTSYFSIRATARLAGISPGTLSASLKTGVLLEPSKMAVFLTEQGFDADLLSKCGDTGVPDTLLTSILEYFTFEAGRFCTATARTNYRILASIGARTLAHKLTGWTAPSARQQSIKEYLSVQLPATPKQWECRFKPEFWAALERLYGLRRGQQACGMFIAHWVYGWFPVEVQDRLKEINPIIGPNYLRSHRHHQHFVDERELGMALDMQISAVTTNLIIARTRNHFKRLMTGSRKITFTKAIAGGQTNA